MENLNRIFADNLVRLRKQYKLTQLELAEKLGYSDKNISKWENGASLPTVEVLVEIAHYFSVSVDYLLSEYHPDKTQDFNRKRTTKDKVIIILMAFLCVALIAVICFISYPVAWHQSWIVFVYGVAAASIVSIVLTAIFFKRSWALFISISTLVWSAVTSVYLSILIFADFNMWYFFFVGVLLQIAVILASLLGKKK